MSYNRTLILTGILFASILIIENMIIPMQAYVFIRSAKSRILGMTCLVVGFILGYGTRGGMIKKNFDDDEDNFNF